MSNQTTVDKIWSALRTISDPEIPVLNIVEMGIVRDVVVSDTEVQIAMTPTYSGCPALDVIRADIEEKIQPLVHGSVQVHIVYSPPWTTDWLTDEAKEKLRIYGISPPQKRTHRADDDILVQLNPRPERCSCPYCNSEDTSLTSEFGSTACKSFYYCNSCRQAFEHFKTI